MSELNVGGSNMTVELRETTLYAKANTGNKQWVAVLTDTHPKYNYNRDFVAYQKPKTADRDSGTATVEDGAVIERVRYTHSGKNRKDRFYQLVDGDAYEIDEADVEAAIDGEIVADVPEESHECEECGGEFDSEHGLAVHQGIKHSDDEETENNTEEATMTESSTDDTSATVMTDGGQEYDAPTTDDFAMDQKTVVEQYRIDGDLYAGIEYHSLEDGLHPDLPHYIISVSDVATIELNIGIARPEFEENWEGGSWGGFLDQYPYDEIGMDVGELLVWQRPHDDEQSYVRDRYTLDKNRVVEADVTVEELAHQLLEMMIDDSEHSLPDDDNDDNGPETVTDGGTEEIRDYRSIQHSDDLVRRYSADGHLYAYRDGDEHVVVSRGDEPGTRWEKRIPMTVKRPVRGQKRWTIPENWEKRVHSKRDSIAYGLFYVPESDVWARVSIPTNDYLTDAWYSVKAVGDLSVEPVGELGSSYDVRRLADDYAEKYGAEGVEEVAEAIKEIASNWEAVEEDLCQTTEWVRDEGLDEMQPGDQPIHADRNWQVTFHQDRIFRPFEALKRVIDFSEYDTRLSVIFHEFRDADLLPSYHKFKLTIDNSDIDMEYHTRGLIEAGASPAEAVDYHMVEVEDMTQTAWAEERGVDQSTVSGNVSQATEQFK